MAASNFSTFVKILQLNFVWPKCLFLCRLNVTVSTYRQYLSCPTLTSRFHFKSDENLDSSGLRGSGYATITASKYYLGPVSMATNKFR